MSAQPQIRASLRIVATGRMIDRLCRAKATVADLDERSVLTDIQVARYKRAARIVKRGLQ